ncbi:MAG: hypothetical protein O6757_11735, partial [Alphaproteobacteria bacterium]|nr:hypothetical protein [Alphaproteobacteria bacterium]
RRYGSNGIERERVAMTRTLRCYAEGRDGDWEAICLDLDIAVQGRSFVEVFNSLNEAINLYSESVRALPEHERGHLLDRPAPLTLRLKFLGYALRTVLGDHAAGGHRHQFTLPLAA